MAHAFRLAPDPRNWLREHLSRTYEAPAVALCGSGTDALCLAILAAWRQAGEISPVALPAFTCFDVATAAVGADARVILYDIDPGTLAPDWDSLGAAVSAGARVVVVAPLYGVPVDWGILTALTSAAGAVVIEDAAQGDGALWRGRPLGSLGELSVLSFGRGKGWTGFAGGAVLARGEWEWNLGEPPEAALTRELGTLAGSLVQQLLARPWLYALPAALPRLGLGETRYRKPTGRPTGITRACAALLHGSLQAATAEREARRQNAERLLAALAGFPGLGTIRCPDGSTPGYLRLPVLLREDRVDSLLRDPSAAELGVAPSYPAPLEALGPVHARLALAPGRLPGSRELARRLVTLPTHRHLRPEDLAHLIRVLDDALRESVVMAQHRASIQ